MYTVIWLISHSKCLWLNASIPVDSLRCSNPFLHYSHWNSRPFTRRWNHWRIEEENARWRWGWVDWESLAENGMTWRDSIWRSFLLIHFVHLSDCYCCSRFNSVYSRIDHCRMDLLLLLSLCIEGGQKGVWRGTVDYGIDWFHEWTPFLSGVPSVCCEVIGAISVSNGRMDNLILPFFLSLFEYSSNNSFIDLVLLWIVLPSIVSFFYKSFTFIFFSSEFLCESR